MTVPRMSLVAAVMVFVSAMHEDMDKRAKQQYRIGKHTQNMRSMFLPQEEHGNREKHAERKPQRQAPGRRLVWATRIGWTVHRLFSFAIAKALLQPNM